MECLDFYRTQGANKMGQGRLGYAYKLIAMDAAVMLQPIVNSYWDLGGKTIEGRVNRGTDRCGKTGIQK